MSGDDVTKAEIDAIDIGLTEVVYFRRVCESLEHSGKIVWIYTKSGREFAGVIDNAGQVGCSLSPPSDRTTWAPVTGSIIYSQIEAIRVARS